jgi:hypothetical protein
LQIPEENILENTEAVGFYEMSRHLESVEDVLREFQVGLCGGPSLLKLEGMIITDP